MIEPVTRDPLLAHALEVYGALGMPSWAPDVTVHLSEPLRAATGHARVAEVTGPPAHTGPDRTVFVLTEATAVPGCPVLLWRADTDRPGETELILETTAANMFKYGSALGCLLDAVRDQIAHEATTLKGH